MIQGTSKWRCKNPKNNCLEVKKQKQSFDGATTAAAEDSGMLNHIG